jgi:putative intracellular protease/amidase
MTRKRVGIILFNDIEVLDFCGPFEVFSATRLNEEKRREAPSPFEVFLVAETPSHVTTTGGMKVLPQYSFEDCPKLDILVVPGGWGTRKELNNSVMLEWLRKRATEVETLTSVCTRLDAAGICRSDRRTACNDSLALFRLDAGFFPQRDC